LIDKSREEGEIAAQKLVDAYWVTYERSLVPLQRARDLAEASYTSANLVCETSKIAYELALAALEGYTYDVPEQRT